MARLSRTGGRTGKAKARDAKPGKARSAKSRKTAMTKRAKAKTTKAKTSNIKTANIKRRVAPAAAPREPGSVSDFAKELKEAREQQAATANILKIIASSPDDVQPVFQAIAERSNHLVRGFATTVVSILDDVVHLSAFTPTTPVADAALRAFYPRPLAAFTYSDAIRKGEIHRIVDTEVELAGQSDQLTMVRQRGWRSALWVPLLLEGKAIGVIGVTRVEPGPFADHHVEMLKTFADQAVIAISNVTLFDEVQARTRDLSESLQQQTATADVLKVISRSTVDLQTVLETLIKSAVDLCGANRGSIFLREGDVFPLKAASHTTPEFLQYWAANPPRAGRGSATHRVIGSGRWSGFARRWAYRCCGTTRSKACWY
jgi:two-component system, NtrC family, sensor kinase